MVCRNVERDSGILSSLSPLLKYERLVLRRYRRFWPDPVVSLEKSRMVPRSMSFFWPDQVVSSEMNRMVKGSMSHVITPKNSFHVVSSIKINQKLIDNFVVISAIFMTLKYVVNGD